jgi:uncharacterized membrane protein
MDEAQNLEEQSVTRSEIDVEKIQQKSNVIEKFNQTEKTRTRKKNQGVKSRRFTHKQREIDLRMKINEEQSTAEKRLQNRYGS